MELVLRYGGIGFAAFALLAVLAYLFGSSPKSKVEPTKPARPAHLIALERLEDPSLQALLDAGDVKGYHALLSEILRSYIESRFGLPAMESTSDEVLALTRSMPIDSSMRTSLADALSISDMAKFAKVKPLPEENTRCLTIIKQFVETTKPKTANSADDE